MGGKPKWLPFNFEYHDVMHPAPMALVFAIIVSCEKRLELIMRLLPYTNQEEAATRLAELRIIN